MYVMSTVYDIHTLLRHYLSKVFIPNSFFKRYKPSSLSLLQCIHTHNFQLMCSYKDSYHRKVEQCWDNRVYQIPYS